MSSNEDDLIKPQFIRLLDVFFIGPLMVAGGVALTRRQHPFWGITLGVLGVTTVLYNGRNYLRIRELQSA